MTSLFSQEVINYERHKTSLTSTNMYKYSQNEVAWRTTSGMKRVSTIEFMGKFVELSTSVSVIAEYMLVQFLNQSSSYFNHDSSLNTYLENSTLVGLRVRLTDNLVEMKNNFG